MPFGGDGGVFVPAFPAIYGGYYVAFGSIYNAYDFVEPDVAAARMAMTFVSGVQIGWFSLGGLQHELFGGMQ